MKILIIAMPNGLSREGTVFLMKMVRSLEASASILSVIDLNRIARIASNEGVDKETARESLVQAAYEDLYAMEDRFKNESVKVTIRTIEVAVPEELIAEIKKGNPDIVCLMGPVDTLWLEMIRGSLAIPIFIVPQEK